MIKKRYNILVILVGFFIAVLSSYLQEAKSIFLTLGILLMLLGLFRISKSIPSKTDSNENIMEDEEE